MAKIGRNEKCPCRSGKKYKHCCAGLAQTAKPEISPEQRLKLTLMNSVQDIQEQAIQRRKTNNELVANTAIPAIDVALPEITETATFAPPKS